LFYSEGNSTLGSTTPVVPVHAQINNQEGTASLNRNMTINLTSPVGRPTVRHFGSFNPTTNVAHTVPAAQWVLAGNGINAPIAATTIRTFANIVNTATVPSFVSGTTANTFGVVIPVNYVGTFTLTVAGLYTITFNVTMDRTASSAVQIGETFVSGAGANRIEWRVIGRRDNQALLITESMQFDAMPNNVHANWDTNIRWDGSNLAAALNGIRGRNSQAPTDAWRARLVTDAAFMGMIAPQTIYTRVGWNNVRFGGYRAMANQQVFVLSEEEVLRQLNFSGTQTADLNYNVFGDVTLFADANSLRSTTFASDEWTRFRSPTNVANQSMVTNRLGAYRTGTLASASQAHVARGVRPSVVINLP